MANKIAKLTLLSMLFSTMLGLGLTSGVSNTLATFTKTAVSYASEDDLNDHTHSSDWVALEQEDFDTNGDYVSGVLTGGSEESTMTYYYLEEDITLSSNDIKVGTGSWDISSYITLCLNGKTLTGTGSSNVIYVTNYTWFNLCDCSGDDSGIITGSNTYSLGDGNGGVSASNARFNMYGGTIKGNNASYGGGVMLSVSTFHMYGGTISGNTAEYTGGVRVADGSTFNMYDGTISDNYGGTDGGVHVSGNAKFNMYGGTITGNSDYWRSGGVYITSGSEFNMYNGTISNNDATGYGGDVNIAGSFSMYGGYFDDNIYDNSGSISITGGYFGTDAYNDDIEDYITASNYKLVDISLIGSGLDENYVAGFEYALYIASTSTYSIEDVTVETYGTKYEPSISGGDVTSVAYTWKDGNDNEISGLPTQVGEYIVTAHILYTTTEEYLTTNYYATTEFKVTISNKGQAVISADATQSKTYDGEVASVEYTVTVGDTDITSDATVTETWYDENDEQISTPTEVGTYKVTLTVTDTDNYDGASTDVTYTITENSSSASTDSTGLSAGAIAGIVIASVFVVGLIAFLVYFFVFRKKKVKKEEKKSSKKPKK